MFDGFFGGGEIALQASHLTLSRTSWLPQRAAVRSRRRFRMRSGGARTSRRVSIRSSWNSWCLVACAMHHIATLLAPEVVERVCWYRVVNLHLPVCGGHQKLLAAAKMVELLSAPAHDSFQPIKVMKPVLGEDFTHLPNPPQVTLKLTVPTPEVVHSALRRGAVKREYHTSGCGCCEIRVNRSPTADKQHIKCCDTCLQCTDGLIIEGWTLGHDDIRVEEKHLSVWLVQQFWRMVQTVVTPRNETAHTLSSSTTAGSHECGT